MIEYSREFLDNGLRVIVHEDKSTPIVAMNLLYDVGSRDESPSATGLAHLFEHLMFSGSVNIPDYDTPLQLAGGENNAFTNNDITNYYLTVPASNIETAFWLESDRMLGLDLTEKNLDVQKKVVIEEFRQRYLNQPYGDIMLKLRPVVYKAHPYRWPTIGMDISHIESISRDIAEEFFRAHYAPNNAILSLAGNITYDKAMKLAAKWFGPIKPSKKHCRNLPVEPVQTEARFLSIEKDVPADVIYKAWHTGKRIDEDLPALDLLTDILAGGESGRLYEKLVRKKKLFSDVNSYITGDLDPGLLVISGRLMKGVSLEKAEKEILGTVNELTAAVPGDEEMNKVKNRFEATYLISNMSVQHKALALCQAELSGDITAVNTETEKYCKVTTEMMRSGIKKYLTDENCTTLYYKSTSKK